MPEEVKEVKTYNVEMLCPKCGNKMSFCGTMLASNPPIYPHECSNCGHEERFKIRYPYQYFVIIE